MRLRAVGCVFAEDEAQLLRAAAPSPTALDALTRRRVAGEPLEHVLGWVDFDGLRLIVTRGVFVPRQRTILLARHAVSAAGSSVAGSSRPVVVELCCGVAPVAAVVARDVPDAQVVVADLDEAALDCARRNAPSALVARGDLFAALPGQLRGRVHVLAMNAPYVPSAAIATMPPEARDHEPLLALDGGPDGTSVHALVAEAVGEWLAPDGLVLIETGRHQSARTAALLRAAGLVTEIITDDDLDATVVTGRPPTSA